MIVPGIVAVAMVGMAALATLLSLCLGVGFMSWRGRRRDGARGRRDDEVMAQAAIENSPLKRDHLPSPIAPSSGPVAGGEG